MAIFRFPGSSFGQSFLSRLGPRHQALCTHHARARATIFIRPTLGQATTAATRGLPGREAAIARLDIELRPHPMSHRPSDPVDLAAIQGSWVLTVGIVERRAVEVGQPVDIHASAL